MSNDIFRYFCFTNLLTGFWFVFVFVFFRGQEFWADLNAMNVYETTEFDQLRRLSTPPSSNVNSIYHTVWKFFCRDHFGWREYPEVFTDSLLTSTFFKFIFFFLYSFILSLQQWLGRTMHIIKQLMNIKLSLIDTRKLFSFS